MSEQLFRLEITGEGEARDTDGCLLDAQGNRVQQPDSENPETTEEASA